MMKVFVSSSVAVPAVAVAGLAAVLGKQRPVGTGIASRWASWLRSPCSGRPYACSWAWDEHGCCLACWSEAAAAGDV